MRFSTRVPMVVLRAWTLGPALVVSFVLTVVVCALLPAGAGVLAFVAAGGTLIVLALGRFEDPAIAGLTRSRPASEAELRVMGPVLVGLGGHGVAVGALFVRRGQSSTTPVALAIGGRAVVITPGLVEATYRGAVTQEEAGAVITHAVGKRGVVRPRLEVAVLAAITPWRMVVAIFRGVGRAFAWLPFMQLAWMLRGVVGVICVVQSVVEGRAAAGLLGGGVIALTYVVPACGRAIEARAESGGDRLVIALGLGPVLAGLLGRFGHPMSLERRQRLAAVPEAPSRPRLHLVRG